MTGCPPVTATGIERQVAAVIAPWRCATAAGRPRPSPTSRPGPGDRPFGGPLTEPAPGWCAQAIHTGSPWQHALWVGPHSSPPGQNDRRSVRRGTPAIRRGPPRPSDRRRAGDLGDPRGHSRRSTSGTACPRHPVARSPRRRLPDARVPRRQRRPPTARECRSRAVVLWPSVCTGRRLRTPLAGEVFPTDPSFPSPDRSTLVWSWSPPRARAGSPTRDSLPMPPRSTQEEGTP